MRRLPLPLIVFATLFAAEGLFAQASDDLTAARRQLLEDVAAMMQSRVLPVMTQWREQFDAQIPGRDRATLENLRERYGMLQENIRHNLRGREAAWENRDYHGFLSIRALLQTNFADRQKLFNDVSRLTMRNERQFAYLGSRIDSTVEEWRGASMRIFLDWFARNRKVISPAMNTPDRDALARLMASCKNIGLEALHDRSKAAFLLWDGEDFTTTIIATGSPDSPLSDCGPERDEILILEAASPNPFTDSTQIRFTLPHAGSTAVRLLNAQGREVRTLVSEARPFGKQMLMLEAKGLAPGNYFVTLETDRVFDTISVRVGR
jgi:hypothetical protein